MKTFKEFLSEWRRPRLRDPWTPDWGVGQRVKTSDGQRGTVKAVRRKHGRTEAAVLVDGSNKRSSWVAASSVTPIVDKLTQG